MVGKLQPAAPSAGASFIELMVAVSIVTVALLVMLGQISVSFRENAINKDRAFAYRKAMALLNEIQNGVERGDISDAASLDVISDLAGYNPNLTVLADDEGQPFAPDHPMSGNVRRQGDWQWGRVVSVSPIEMQETLRQVTVKVYQRRNLEDWDAMATVSGVVSLRAAAYPATKYYDVYFIAIAETPSLWLPLPSAQGLMEVARAEMQTIENGLKLRSHWITKFGYGRDELYLPFANNEISAESAAPGAYWYPSLVNLGGEASLLYAPELMSGRVRTESDTLNDYDATANPVPHAVADQFNHCSRLPAARELFDERIAAGLENEGEPPLQLLLDDLWRDPERYRNAIFVNLHSPGLPLPPMRNYSDAAKEPVGLPGVRAVTHAERLWSERDPLDYAVSDRVALRVHAYKADPDLGAATTDTISLQIMGVDLSGSVNALGTGLSENLEIYRLPGGVDPTTGTVATTIEYSGFELAPELGAGTSSHEMCWEAGYVGGPEPYTWIQLHNTPVVTPQSAAGKGLATSQRLYGMEYIPSPVAAGGSTFSIDLASTGSGPKNTARWRLVLPRKVFDSSFGGGFGGNADQVVEVTTRLGSDAGSGVAWPTPYQPHNASTTYAWWTANATSVPEVERYQLQGDPRHNPYLDLVAGVGAFAHGYNWHFDDLRESLHDATVEWPCFDRDRLQDGFGAGHVADVPRLLQLFRGGLQSAGAVFVHPCGPTAQALLMGGEIGLPGLMPGDLPTPVTLAGEFLGLGAPVATDSISPSSSSSTSVLGRHVVVGTGATPFWAKAWLGELFPDSLAATWHAVGNLPTGSLPGTFHRAPRNQVMLPDLPLGTDFGFGVGSSLGLAGGVAMLDAGLLTSTFVHGNAGSSSLGNITPEATEIMQAVGDPLPTATPCGWPFATAGTFPGALPYFGYALDYPKSLLELLEIYYDAASLAASVGLVRIEEPLSAKSAFLTVQGMSPVDELGHQSAALSSLMFGLRAFHRAGEPAVAGRITQTPRVEFVQPVEGSVFTDPASILMRWKVQFNRFDGQAYTSNYPAGFVEPESDLQYVLYYSRDQGETWRYALDSRLAQIEQRPDAAYQTDDSVTGTESWNVTTGSTEYVGAEYVLRVECYHKTRLTHLAAHQVRVTITR